MDSPERPTMLGLFAAGFAFLAPVAFTPAVQTPFWTAKAALLPPLAAVGIPLLLLRPASDLRFATLSARAFLAVAAVSTALATRPALAVVGHYGWGTGLVFIAALCGAWAIGIRLADVDVRLLRRGLLAAVVLNALVAVAEMRFDLHTFGLGRTQQRAPGLMGNPIFLGPLLVVGAVLLAPALAGRTSRADRRRVAVACAVVALLGAALSLSGSRTALVLSVTVVAWTGRRQGGVAALLLGLGLAAGWGAGPFLDHPPRAPQAAQGPSATAPTIRTGVAATVAAEGRPLTPRLATWWAARSAVAERPLFGSGPGQFQSATVHHRPATIERDTPGRYFLDAHNLVVEYAVTTGVFGVTALLAWVVLAARGAGGPFLIAGLVLLAGHLVEPQNVALTPIAFLALGAAATSRKPPPAGLARTAVPLAFTGLAAGAVLLYGDFLLNQARLDYRLQPALQADRLLRPWPQPAVELSHIFVFRGSLPNGPTAVVTGTAMARAADMQARNWLLVATSRAPDSVPLWISLADFEYSHGQLARARADYGIAAGLDASSTAALGRLGDIAVVDGNPDLALRWYRRASSVDPSLGDPNVRLARVASSLRRTAHP